MSEPDMSKQYSKDEMVSLTKSVMNYLDSWNVTPEQMVGILGLGEKFRTRHLQSFRLGEKSLEQTDDIMVRIDHIAGIADALRTTFPFSETMRVMWLHKPHRRFRKRAPMEVILDEGTNGLMKVRIEVDCNYGYKISEALQEQQATKSS